MAINTLQTTQKAFQLRSTWQMELMSSMCLNGTFQTFTVMLCSSYFHFFLLLYVRAVIITFAYFFQRTKKLMEKANLKIDQVYLATLVVHIQFHPFIHLVTLLLLPHHIPSWNYKSPKT